MPRLMVVATPIGNLGDLTDRAREALASADLIAAEDTRVTMKLLNHLGLKKPMVSCHRHNEPARAPELAARMLAEDLTVALTCDAGTPGISDPGQLLVEACWQAGIPVEPIPGPSAVATAISASGFDAREFAFYGFLPRERGALVRRLKEIAATGLPAFVLYESPHRVVELTEAIAETLPGCRLAVCSDLTKRFERIYRGPAAEVLAALKENPNVEKGEYCLVCAPDEAAPKALETPEADAEDDLRLALLRRMLEGESLRNAADALRAAGKPRNEVYRARLAVAEMLEREAEEE